MAIPRYRRTLLGVIATGLAIGLAGCEAPTRSGTGPSGERPSPSPMDAATGDPIAVEHVDVGHRTGEVNPHSVEVWNATADPRAIRVEVVDVTASETPYTAGIELPADGSLELSLRTPHTYRVEVSVPAAELGRTVRVSERSFDTCNDHRTVVRILRDTVEVRSLSTELLCRTATDG